MKGSTPLLDIARVARERVRDGHRHLIFNRAMHVFLRDPAAAAADEELLEDLVYGWGNTGWSGKPELLRQCILDAVNAAGPVLECGSGLTTLLVGAAVRIGGNRLWSLEHMPEWAERVSAQLAKFGIDSAHLCVVPLTDMGEYQWYAPPAEVRSLRFRMVVCDGPPSSTTGGRYGLFPVMESCLAEGCIVLLDDAERDDEQAVVRRWCRERHCSSARLGVTKPFFRLVVEDEGTGETPSGPQAGGRA